MRGLRITGFIWLDEIVEKLGWKHQVEPHEVEELFSRRPKFRFVESGNRESEDVYAALGQTETGRYLVVFFIRKSDDRVLPISARDMTAAERERHARK
jgi:uncharacterized DUF497 family protein